MTAELTEARIEQIRVEGNAKTITEWFALCDAALAHVRGQKPCAWRIEHSAGVGHWHLSSYKPEALPEGVTATPLFTTPQPTYRDGLLAAAKIADWNNCTILAAQFRELADKEG